MPAPDLSRDLLSRDIAFRLQEKEQGGLSASIERRLIALAKEFKADKAAPPPVSTILRPGMQLVRSWHGHTHRVVVIEDGFLWNGSSYASLSSIAQAITGTKWSGPRFFGLRRKEGITVAAEKTRAAA